MAEKFSKFRDPGTGIQVFLTPVAASTSSSSSGSASSAGGAAVILTPILVVFGLIRALIGGICWGLYMASGSAGLLRVVLFMLGFIRLPVEEVASGASGRRSVSGSKHVAMGAVSKTVGKGDLVLSNHSSWIDLLIVSYLYPGIGFVVPVVAEGAKVEAKRSEDASAAASRRTPKKNAMSANTRIVTPSSASSTTTSNQIPIVGYTVLGLTQALKFVGGLPPSKSQLPSSIAVSPDIETTLRSAESALALFPEIVTSNNRALLSFSGLPTTPSVASTHILTLKYSPPSSTSTTSVYAVPGPTNPLSSHLLQILLLSNPLRAVSIRHTTLSSTDHADSAAWAENIAGLMSSMARLKRTSIAWESKREFLQMVLARGKRT